MLEIIHFIIPPFSWLGPKSERILQLLFNILLWNVKEFLFPPLTLFLTFNPRIDEVKEKVGRNHC